MSRCSLWISTALLLLSGGPLPAQEVRKLTFDGVLPEHRIAIKQIDPSMPTDWSAYTHLVMDMRTSTPQRFSLWIYTASGPRRLMLQPFGQNAWLRASIPLQFFRGRDQSGTDLASTNNRRTNSFWMSVWGPFGELRDAESIGFAMQYPINNPTLELRRIHLAGQNEGSEFLEKTPVVDEFGQWAHADWPRKIKNREQLEKELAEEEKAFGSGAEFGYCAYGGYRSTQAKATGFFRIEEIDGKWWFVDPHGHLYLSIGSNGAGSGFGGGRGQSGGSVATLPQSGAAPDRLTRRLESWGLTTGGQGKPRTVFLRGWPRGQVSYLGLPDVYAENFERGVDEAARSQCSPLKGDPLILGYFIGNEPPWGGRENELVDMVLNGQESATRSRLKEFLTQGDTPARRKQFVVSAFQHYLDLICAAIKKYDANHLNLGIRFGGNPEVEVLRCGRIFDVCSINVYEYEPTKQIERTYRLTGRPVLLGEFHIGVPENGLGAGLVQAMNQTERGIAYRYFIEQAASLDGFLGAHWFQWRDQPVLGRMDGENYNIGFVDVTDRHYPELVEAAKQTHKRLYEVHSGKDLPFNRKPKASEAGAPSSPWDLH